MSEEKQTAYEVLQNTKKWKKESKKTEKRIDCDNPTVCPGDYHGKPDCFGCPIYVAAQKH